MTKVLFLGCHADDIELGCGATINKHKNWDTHCVTLSASSFSPLGRYGEHPDIWQYQKEALVDLGVKAEQIHWLEHKTNFFDQERTQIYNSLRLIKEQIKPQLVFTQESDDNLDHSVLYNESIRVFQGCSLMTYHIARSQPVFNANHYEVVSEDNLKAKLTALSRYTMYQDKNYFNKDFIRAQLVCQAGYIGETLAETFRIIKIIKHIQ